MSGLFSSPKIPAPPPPQAPPPVPTMDNARQRQRDMDALAGRRGRAAMILTGPTGDLAPPTTGTKTLLGG